MSTVSINIKVSLNMYVYVNLIYIVNIHIPLTLALSTVINLTYLVKFHTTTGTYVYLIPCLQHQAQNLKIK